MHTAQEVIGEIFNVHKSYCVGSLRRMRRCVVRGSDGGVADRARSVVSARALEGSSYDAPQAEGEREDGGDEDGDDGDDGGFRQLHVAEELSRRCGQ